MFVRPSDFRTAAYRGQLKKEEAYRKELVEIARARSRMERYYEKHVDRLLERLPLAVEQAIAKNKYTLRGWIKVENVNIREMKDHDCGTAKPKPGTYVEYLFNRLEQFGLKPQCEYDERWGFFGWYGMMCIESPQPELFI